jgi:hypothetical protein
LGENGVAVLVLASLLIALAAILVRSTDFV